MVRSILVPLDGSAVSEQSLPLALSLARRLDASLEIVHVHVPLQSAYGALRTPHHDLLDAAMRERAREYIDSVVKRAAEVDVRLTATLLDGEAAEAIDRHVAATGVDLLVLTTHGPGPLGRYWLGSVADALVRHVARPVLLVPPRAEPPELSCPIEFRQMLVPLDGSHRAEEILEPAMALVAGTECHFTLMQVVAPMLPGYPPGNTSLGGPVLDELRDLYRRECDEVQSMLEKAAERVRARSLQADTLVVSHEQPATAIIEQAAALGADLIALATHGRGGLKRLMLGSVASRVVRDAAIPVLVYRPIQPESEQGG